MKNFVYILIFLALSFNVCGQIKKNNLIGEWQTKNDDNLYYKTDTINLFKDINHFYNTDTDTQQLILWTINKKYSKIQDLFIIEPTRASVSKDLFKLKLKKTDYGQIISFETNGQIFDKFKIVNYKEKNVDRYPYTIKEIRLIRFDKLSEHKLFKYVDSLIYRVLLYDSTLVDSTTQNIQINPVTTYTKIIIRDEYDSNPEPLIVLNGHVVNNKEILKQFRLVEIRGISYLTKENASSFYGQRAINGVIILLVSKKRFREIWKTNGR